MEFEKALMARRMVRNFKSDLIPEHLLETIVASSLRTPSAGFTQGVELVVLQGNETHTYWECTTTEQWRKSTSRKGLFNAPVVIILICDPEAYAARYSEPDKAESGLGAIGAWDVPYWWMDTGMTAFALMLSAFDKGLGAGFLGMFRGEKELMGALEVPSRMRCGGAVLMGHPAKPDPLSKSAARGRRPPAEIVHRTKWSAPR